MTRRAAVVTQVAGAVVLDTHGEWVRVVEVDLVDGDRQPHHLTLPLANAMRLFDALGTVLVAGAERTPAQVVADTLAAEVTT